MCNQCWSLFLTLLYVTVLAICKVTVEDVEYSENYEGHNSEEDIELSDWTEDCEEEATWPPAHVSLDDDPALWPGHLEPLGSQFPKKNVEVYKNFPPVKVFYEEYVIPSSAVLLKGAVSKLGGIGKEWKLESLRKAGRAAVTYVHVKREEETLPTKMSLRSFAKKRKEERLNINGKIPKEMRNQIILPRALNCTNVTNEMHDTLLTVMEGGYKDSLRSERHDSLVCQIEGMKEVLLLSYISFPKWSQVMDEDEGTKSGVNVHSVDFTQYADLREADYRLAVVEPGDCIFIPYMWLYQTSNKNTDVSFRLRWQHKVFTPSGRSCGDHSSRTTLAQLTFRGEESKGEAQETFIPLKDIEILAYLIEVYLEDGMEMSPTQFQANLKFDKTLLEKLIEWDEECVSIAEELFSNVDLNEDGVFSESDLDQLTPETLPRLVGLLQDRMADFQDIMNDQRAEKEKGSVDDQLKRYLKDYEKQMKDVMETEFRKVLERAKRISGNGSNETSTLEETFPHLYKETEETKKKLRAREDARMKPDNYDEEEEEDEGKDTFKTAEELKLEHRKRQEEREKRKQQELTEDEFYERMNLDETEDEADEEIFAEEEEEAEKDGERGDSVMRNAGKEEL